MEYCQYYIINSDTPISEINHGVAKGNGDGLIKGTKFKGNMLNMPLKNGKDFIVTPMIFLSDKNGYIPFKNAEIITKEQYDKDFVSSANSDSTAMETIVINKTFDTPQSEYIYKFILPTLCLVGGIWYASKKETEFNNDYLIYPILGLLIGTTPYLIKTKILKSNK